MVVCLSRVMFSVVLHTRMWLTNRPCLCALRCSCYSTWGRHQWTSCRHSVYLHFARCSQRKTVFLRRFFEPGVAETESWIRQIPEGHTLAEGSALRCTVLSGPNTHSSEQDSQRRHHAETRRTKSCSDNAASCRLQWRLETVVSLASWSELIGQIYITNM